MEQIWNFIWIEYHQNFDYVSNIKSTIQWLQIQLEYWTHIQYSNQPWAQVHARVIGIVAICIKLFVYFLI